jgi:DsbC/DsbD-like thiol-disulfide interchange protein
VPRLGLKPRLVYVWAMLKFRILLRAGVLALACAALAPALARAQSAAVNVRADLVSSRAVIAPGETFTIALRQQIADGWHTYWRNPGDSGEPTKLDWTTPAGFTIAPNEWPAPEVYHLGPITGFIYSGTVLLPMSVTAPKSLRPGQRVDLKAHASWLVCSEICIPEETNVSLRLQTAKAGKDDPNWAVPIAAAEASIPKPEGLTAQLQKLPGKDGKYQLVAEGAALTGVRAPMFLPFAPDVIDHAADQAAKVEADKAVFTLTPSVVEGKLGGGPLNGIVLYKASVEGREVSRAIQIEAQLGQPATAPAQAGVSGEDMIYIALAGLVALAFLGLAWKLGTRPKA